MLSLLRGLQSTTNSTFILQRQKYKGEQSNEFCLFDMVYFSISALLGIDTLGAISSQGGQALTWVLISAITFFVPYGMLVAELGSTFSQEGGVYEWCKLAGGRFYAALVVMLYWVSNPLWVGGTLAVTAVIDIKPHW